jgi:light-regulated signal transduction histidine kinase (bacteriophytochrome)
MLKSRYIDDQQEDINHCEGETIRTSGLIQSHSAMVVIKEPELTIIQVSANARSHFGFAPEELIGQPLTTLLGEAEVQYLRDRFLSKNLESAPRYLPAAQIGRGDNFFELILHRRRGLLILECERKPEDAVVRLDLYPTISGAIAQMQRSRGVREFCQIAADEVRRLTGFDRVMVYKFNEDGSGNAIVESLSAGFKPYLGLRYPASDIPSQTRAICLKRWLRMEADVNDQSVSLTPAINPVTRAPLDMSFAVTHGLSSAHTEYLKNIGVTASMFLSILNRDRLWGMVVCYHHNGPKYTPHDARMACEFLAHFLSLQMTAKEEAESHEYTTRLNQGHAYLVESMATADNYRQGLLKDKERLSGWIEADGVALCSNDQIRLIGAGPNEEQTRRLAEWLRQNVEEEVFATDHLAARFPEALKYQNAASGLLAARISRRQSEYILWFRSSVKQVVNWAGDPPNGARRNGERLTSRHSIITGYPVALWQETVEGKAMPWKDPELKAAGMLRRSILEIMARKAEEMVKLNAELERSNIDLDSFVYIASHDLKEPLRGIHNYSHFLIEDYADKLDKAGLEKLQTLIKLTQRMEALIDSLFHFSRVGHADLAMREVDLEETLGKTLELISPSLLESGVEIRRPRPLPVVRADHARVGEIFHNLIVNAIKYNDKPSKWVEIGWEEAPRREGETEEEEDGPTGRPTDTDVLGSGNVQTRPQDESAEFAPSPRRPVALHSSPVPQSSPSPVFYVRDNGIGIPERHFETIFGIFKRLHGRDEFGGGVGAGLTIVKKIVERHNGRVWIESQLGEGTTVYFTIR